MDDWPTPIVKLLEACEYAQLMSNFAVEYFSRFLVANVMHPFMRTLNKMSR